MQAERRRQFTAGLIPTAFIRVCWEFNDAKRGKEMSEKFERAVRLFNELKEDYELYAKNFKDIRDLIIPNRASFYDDNPQIKNKINYGKIINNAGYRAAKTFAYGMCNGLMPKEKKWFNFDTQDLDEQESIYCQIAVRKILNVAKKSKLYTFLPLMFLDSKTFGYSALGTFYDYDAYYKILLLDIGTYFYALDAFGNIMHFGRYFSLTAQEIEREFGKNADENVAKAVNGKDYKTKFLIHQLITPNEKKNAKEWKSLHWIKGAKKFLKEGGYGRFPFIITIIDRANVKSIYGNCAGMQTLGNVRMLQKLETMSALGVEKSVKPPVSVNSSEDIEEVNLLPDGVTKVSGNNAHAGVEPIYKGALDLQSVEYKIAKTENNIISDFDADLFAVSNSIKQQTAYEVEKLVSQNVIKANALVNSYSTEFCEPFIRNTHRLLVDAGILVPPENMDIDALDIKYLGDLAVLQDMQKANNLQRFSAYVGQLLQVKPDLLDHFNIIKIAKLYAQYMDIDKSVENDNDTVLLLGKQRQAQAAAQAADLNAQKAIAAMKSLSQTKTTGDTALGNLAGRVSE
jgi:hypothetical protein